MNFRHKNLLCLVLLLSNLAYPQNGIGISDNSYHEFNNPALITQGKFNIQAQLVNNQVVFDQFVQTIQLAGSQELSFLPIKGVYAGVSVLKQDFNVNKRLVSQINIAYKLKLFQDWTIAAGVQGRILNQRLDLNQLSVFQLRPDPSLTSDAFEDVKIKPSFGAGFTIINPRLSAGVNVTNFAKNNAPFNNSVSSFYLQYKLDINNSFYVIPRVSNHSFENLNPISQIQLPIGYNSLVELGPVLRYQASNTTLGNQLTLGALFKIELLDKFQLSYGFIGHENIGFYLPNHQFSFRYRISDRKQIIKKNEAESSKENKVIPEKKKTLFKKLFSKDSDKAKEDPSKDKSNRSEKKSVRKAEKSKVKSEKIIKENASSPVLIEKSNLDEIPGKIDSPKKIRIEFQKSSDTITNSQNQKIKALVTFFQSNPTTNFNIITYTDCSGQLETNQELAQRRAQTIIDVLLENDIPAEKIQSEFKVEFSKYEIIFGGVKQEARAKVIRENLVALGIETDIVFVESLQVFRVIKVIEDDYFTVDKLTQKYRDQTGIQDIWIRSDCQGENEYRFSSISIL